MTDFTLRAITATAGSAASCVVSTHGTLIERPAITRARPRTAPGILLIEALSEALGQLKRTLKPDDFVTIEFAGVKSTEIDTESRIAFRQLLHALGEQDIGFGIVELEEAPKEMVRQREAASFAAAMGMTGLAR